MTEYEKNLIQFMLLMLRLHVLPWKVSFMLA